MTRALLTFFSLTFAATWTAWAAAGALARAEGVAAAFAGAVFLLGVFAPALVALALTYRGGGRAAAAELVGRVFRWQVSARWYVFAVAFIPAVELSVALVHRLATGVWPRFGPTAWYVMVAAILVSTWAQAGEEIGWRGYALPRLSERMGLASGSVVLGVVWAVWHLPLFFFGAGDTVGQSFPLYLLQVTAISVVAAWLYWRTGGSLLLVMLLHAATNNTKDIVLSPVPGAADPFTLRASREGWLTVAVLWMVAAYLLVQMRGVSTLADAGPAGEGEPASAATRG